MPFQEIVQIINYDDRLSDITSCEVNGDDKNVIKKPLLKGNPNHYVLIPIKDGDVSTVCVYNHQESQLNSLFLTFIPKIWLMYNKAIMASFWTGKSVRVSIVLSYMNSCVQYVVPSS